jgi:hypothetical protein
LTSTCASKGHVGRGDIIKENFDRTIALFTARKSTVVNWINDKDEYLVPNVDHPDYRQWNADAIVYAMFNSASQQSSLRGVQYKGRRWDVRNQFFFMGNAEVRDLADKAGFMEMYEDAKRFPEDAFVQKRLSDTILSTDAKEVLAAARELVRTSLALRATFAEEHPELHLGAWDAGWAQLKPLLKAHFKPQYEEFVARYKAFEARMREGVYKFGFLK